MATTTNKLNPTVPHAAHTNGNTNVVDNATGTNGTGVGKTRGFGRHHARGGSGPRPQRLTPVRWVRLYWLDVLTMAAMAAIALGVYYANPAPSRNFPLTYSNGQIVNPEYAYPLRKEIIPIWLAAFLSFIVPFLFFLLAQIKVRSFEDLSAATMGLLWALITAAVFQVMIKWLIGGIRPHFLAACRPVVPGGLTGRGFENIMFNRRVCTGNRNQVNDSLQSMPSGHSTAACAGFVFLTLYMNAKLKFLANYRPAYWKMVLCFAPLLGAFLISTTPTIDKYHHWYDLLVGAIIGTVCAFAAYRATYAAIYDFRFNHIPLPRAASQHDAERNPDSFGYGPASMGLSNVHAATEKGGWGKDGRRSYGGDIGGAPGDADFVGGGGEFGGAGSGGLGRHTGVAQEGTAVESGLGGRRQVI